MKFIHVASFPCTGTWFMLRMLEAHPDTTGFVQMKDLCERVDGSRGEDRQPTPDRPMMKQFIDWKCEGDNVNILHSHMECAPSQYEISSVVTLPTVVPMRDPLASLITQHQKHTNKDHSNRVRTLSDWFEIFDTIDCRLAFFPVDVMNTTQKRMIAVKDVYDHMGLKDSQIHTQRWVYDWPLDINTRGVYEMKRRYLDGDVDYISATLGDAWCELQRCEDVLRPRLVALGYRRLLWWS
jgi:hypothetical protein